MAGVKLNNFVGFYSTIETYLKIKMIYFLYGFLKEKLNYDIYLFYMVDYIVVL